MKRNNFFISLLICVGLMFAVSSCCKDCIEEPFIPVDCPPNVIICEETFENTSEMQDTFGLPFGISDVRIEGNNLKFTITASGCSGSSWVAKLVSDGKFMMLPSEPPQGHTKTLRILFENSEICTGIAGREFSFNVECLRIPNINRMWFHISGTEHSLLYEW